MDWRAADVAQALSSAGKGRSRKKGRGWMAPCPAHSDMKPSLHLNDGQKGLLWHCHAGCAQEEVFEALKSVLGGGDGVKRSAPRPRLVEDRFEAHLPTDDEIAAVTLDSFYTVPLGGPSKVWTYHTPQGRAAGYVARYEVEDGKEILPWSWQSKNGNEPRLMAKAWESDRLLYNAHQLAERPDAPVLYVEGEKAADAATSLFPNFVVTTHQGGGSAYSKTDLQVLHGRTIVILPDHDAPGDKMAEGLSLQLMAHAKVRIMDWPTHWPDGQEYHLRHSSDAHDHKAAGWAHQMISQLHKSGKIALRHPDPVAQFGDGDATGSAWGRVTMMRDGTCALVLRGRILARCPGAAWRQAAGAVEADINERILRQNSRLNPGRFPRWRGETAVAPSFNGDLYMIIELLGRGGDVDACKMQWLSTHRHARGKPFAALEKQMLQEMKAAA